MEAGLMQGGWAPVTGTVVGPHVKGAVCANGSFATLHIFQGFSFEFNASSGGAYSGLVMVEPADVRLPGVGGNISLPSGRTGTYPSSATATGSCLALGYLTSNIGAGVSYSAGASCGLDAGPIGSWTLVLTDVEPANGAESTPHGRLTATLIADDGSGDTVDLALSF